MGIDVEQVAQDTVDSIGAQIKKLKKLNIIIAGKTGVGKSTLINSVFKGDFAETGTGKPITSDMVKIEKPGMPLTIYDTPGLELGKENQKKVKEAISNTIKKGLSCNDINEVIHCIWYCISAVGDRIEQEEIELLRDLTDDESISDVPVFVVLTKALSKDKAQILKKEILEEKLDILGPVVVLAQDYKIDEEYTKKAYGLDELIKLMGSILPEELKETLINIQKADLQSKKIKSHAIVAAAAATSAAEGAIPIPFSDAFVLIPTQVTMIASITVVFGFDVNKSILSAIISSALGAGGATILGKTVVTGLLKCIPGAGTVVGGVISSATAGVITTALGEAYISIMEKVFKGEMSLNDLASAKGKNEMSTLFVHNLKTIKWEKKNE